MIEEIKATNTERVAALTNQLRTEFVREANSLANQEHQRIINDLNAVGVSIPADKHNLPLVVIRGTVCPVKSVLFSTDRVYGTLAGWTGRIHRTNTFWTTLNTLAGVNILQEVGERLTEFKLSVQGIPLRQHTCAVMYALYQDKILMSRQLWHTLSSVVTDRMTWYQMCIGNNTGTQFWTLPFHSFSTQVSELNMDSPASTEANINGEYVDVIGLITGMSNKQVRLLRPEERW
jgi:hypothetical protein